jgi:ATP-dependent DNA helicase RecQ
MKQLLPILKQYWGYDQLLPLQGDAMSCVMEGRDSVVVLPTGGGKSLCYQAPAMALPGMAVIVSPLISLMKDQVDALTSCGVPAACFNSMLTTRERNAVVKQLHSKKLKLLYIAPERLAAPGFLDMLRRADLSFVAIDEAHCISIWGHDFRKDYRELGIVKETFPKLAVHAYTATATEKVRADIAEQLSLREPAFHVGSFDRPNLMYRVSRRVNRLSQVCQIIDRHKGESGIIYCISRRNVDDLCAALRENGYKALPYHAGMEDDDRKRNQDAFTHDQTDIIVATVAFGMGIDKSNVRYVIHDGAPKSIEHYQQETGRAGRDNLEAECVLLFTSGDFGTWRRILEDLPDKIKNAAYRKLSEVEHFCIGMQCRHQALVQYFGQRLPDDHCKACDVCLDEGDTIDNALVVGQKILSCVVRLKESFGAEHTAAVLTGSKSQPVLERRHHKLKTHGALADSSQRDVRDWIEQMIAGQYLERVGDFRQLKVTAKGWEIIRGETTPRLLAPARKVTETHAVAADSWEGVDEGLFDELRSLRKRIADQRSVPAFVIFSDATLREMARRRPSDVHGMLGISGVGRVKFDDFGDAFLGCITHYCRKNSLTIDVTAPPATRNLVQPLDQLSISEQRAYKLFKQQLPLDQVATLVGRALSTTTGYLEAYIKREHLTSPGPWINEPTFNRIRAAVAKVGDARLKPVFDALGGKVDYGMIRVAVACLHNRALASVKE